MTEVERLAEIIAEHSARDSQAFLKLELGQEKILRSVGDLNGTIADVLAELGGVPSRTFRAGRPTLRERLHKIETENAASRAMQEALELVRKQSVAADQRRWTRWQKWATLVGVLVAACSSVARLFGISI